MQNKKTVAVLRTRQHSLFSNFIYMNSGRGYTHASIALDNTYVSEPAYENIRKLISEVVDKQNEYQYSRLGIFLCMLRIRHRFKKHYFCSQFVAEMLSASGAVRLKRHSSLYLPNQFVKELECQPCLCNILYNGV